MSWLSDLWNWRRNAREPRKLPKGIIYESGYGEFMSPEKLALLESTRLRQMG